MKKTIKGFTLVELIVVMAIMSILMVGVMQLFKPIRTLYVDSTLYETQRTAQNGVIKYITECVRYSTDMGVYNNVTSADAAAKAFAEAYCDTYGYNKASTDNLNKIKKHVDILIIDNKTKHYSKDYTGRLVRRKVDDTSTTIADPLYSSTNSNNNVIATSTTNKWRTALGEAYYGENTYYITLDTSDSASGMLSVSVVSTRNGKRDISQAGKESNITGNITRGGVLCRNLTDTSNHGVTKAGTYSVNYTADNSKNAYIVFVTRDSKEKIEAEGLSS